MSKLKGILLLLIAAIVMGCSSQPKQPKEEPVAEKQQAETAPAEEKTAKPQQDEKNSTGDETTVYFAPKTYKIDTFTAQKLDSIAELLKAKNVTQIKIVGHSAKMDSTKDEEKLSLQRTVF